MKHMDFQCVYSDDISYTITLQTVFNRLEAAQVFFLTHLKITVHSTNAHGKKCLFKQSDYLKGWALIQY